MRIAFGRDVPEWARGDLMKSASRYFYGNGPAYFEMPEPLKLDRYWRSEQPISKTTSYRKYVFVFEADGDLVRVRLERR